MDGVRKLRNLLRGGCREIPKVQRYSEEELDCLWAKQNTEELSGFELIVAVDFTKSNAWTGKESFGGRCLHAIGSWVNPYMLALTWTAATLGVCDDDRPIRCYGFGDIATSKSRVFSFYPENQPARGLVSVLERYKEIAASVNMSGPTSFAPLIRQAVRDVYNSGMKFHVLLILADGQISEHQLEETKKAIVEACDFPLSILMIGVGDGPWDDMTMFDNGLPDGTWDNFHFFDYKEDFNWWPFNQGNASGNSLRSQIQEKITYQYKHAMKLTGEDKKGRVVHLLENSSIFTAIDLPGERG